jgi:hypothetical protein
VLGHIAIPWITDYLDELRAITKHCERPRPEGVKCIQCREKDRIIGQIEDILKEHGDKDDR